MSFIDRSKMIIGSRLRSGRNFGSTRSLKDYQQVENQPVFGSRASLQETNLEANDDLNDLKFVMQNKWKVVQDCMNIITDHESGATGGQDFLRTLLRELESKVEAYAAFLCEAAKKFDEDSPHIFVRYRGKISEARTVFATHMKRLEAERSDNEDDGLVQGSVHSIQFSAHSGSSAGSELVIKKARAQASKRFADERVRIIHEKFEEEQRGKKKAIELKERLNSLKLRQEEEEIRLIEKGFGELRWGRNDVMLNDFDLDQEQMAFSRRSAGLRSFNEGNQQPRGKVVPDPFASTEGRRFKKQLDNIRTPLTEVNHDLGRLNETVGASNEHSSSSLMKGIEGLQRRILLPAKDIPTFSGNDIELYLPFKLAFQQMIEDYCSTDQERYQYLLQYTTGDALELVRSCFRFNAVNSYQLAIRSLEEEYGDQYLLARKYIDKLKDWPSIRRDDGAAMKRFSLFLKSINNMMGNDDEFLQLNHPTNIKEIIDKLPQHMGYKWRDYAFDLGQRQHRAKFADLVVFVKREADVLNQPIYGEVRKNDNADKGWGTRSTRKVLMSKTENVTKQTSPPSYELSNRRLYTRKSEMCLFCKEAGHLLEDCRSFAEVGHENKVQFIREAVLCFGCLRQGHFSKNCRFRLRCNKCNTDKHPEVLHKDQELIVGEGSGFSRDRDRSWAHAVRSTGKAIISPAVPVKVKSISGLLIDTCIALDSWASANFISRKMVSRLGYYGKKSKIRLSTIMGEEGLDIEVIPRIVVKNWQNDEEYSLSNVHIIENWPFKVGDLANRESLERYDHLKNIEFGDLDSGVGILVGSNEPNLVKPLEVVSGDDSEPYAIRYSLGWAVSGPTVFKNLTTKYCHSVSKLASLEMDIDKFYRQDFDDPNPGELGISVEDKLWLTRVKNSLVKTSEGHYQIDLPFRNSDVRMPNNYGQARASLSSLERRFGADDKYRQDYCKFMDKLICNGYLEKIPFCELRCAPGKCWYLVHHAVYHKTKGKVRVVFDCSRRSAGVSLNDELLKGPDLMNKLIGVIARFREESVAFMGDIEQMFMQIKVPVRHSDFMRVLWWPGGEMTHEPVQYRLRAHTFGAASSPSIANFAVKQAAIDASDHVNSEAINTLQHCAYVDDIMRSLPTETQAIEVLREVRSIAKSAGFNLAKIVSNSRMVLCSLPPESLAEEYQEIDLGSGNISQGRALGVLWKVDNDEFSFKINIQRSSLTRRGMLSVIGSIFDPLGLVTPVLIFARSLFQDTCRRKLEWDDELPIDIRNSWKEWMNDILLLEKFSIPRCIKVGLGNVVRSELHVFCDGSLTAYAAVAYARFIDFEGNLSCTLLMSKVRQTPVGGTALRTVPRIELNAARMAILLAQSLKRETFTAFDVEYYWSDSQTVLKYIRSGTCRFQRFVENRVTLIRSHSAVSDWHYVPTNQNVADVASRGCGVSLFLNREDWIYGPGFLWEKVVKTFEEPSGECDSLELKVNATRIRVAGTEIITTLLESTSNWKRLRFRVAVFDNLTQILGGKDWDRIPFNTLRYERAELFIWKYVQSLRYEEQIETLKNDGNLQRGDILRKLCPFLDENGLLRVGGRLAHCHESYGTRNPIILYGKHGAVHSMVRDVHLRTGHFGKSFLISILQENYYIVGMGPLVKKIIGECFFCSKLNSRPITPIMSSLPESRVAPAQKPFWKVGIDFFGPFLVILGRGRARHKQYGVVFTCLASRAIHLEVAESLDISSFLQAFRRFIARRGTVRVVYSDNGTNLVGGCRELKEAVSRWDESQVQSYAAPLRIEWHFNPPTASHFGGVWEREIRSVRKVILGLISDHDHRLTGEVLRTFMCEAEYIMNSRPLTPVTAESTELGPITPNHLLLVKTVEIAPTGNFTRDKNSYSTSRWRYAQYLVEVFWLRWRKEYLRTLLLRKKWNTPKSNLAKDDLVLLTDPNVPRGQWPLGVVDRVLPSADGVVRKVIVRVSSQSKRGEILGTTLLERPVVKLIPVLKREN